MIFLLFNGVEMSEKLCVNCTDVKPVSDFIRKTSIGKSHVHRICNDCERYERLLERIAEKRYNQSLIKRVPPTKPIWRVVEKNWSYP